MMRLLSFSNRNAKGGGGGHRTSKSIDPPRFKPWVEQLESRTLLAGDTTECYDTSYAAAPPDSDPSTTVEVASLDTSTATTSDTSDATSPPASGESTSPPGTPTPPPIDNPPRILSFTASYDSFSGLSHFYGTVADEHVVGVTVQFGGLLAGHSVKITDSGGSFFYSLQLNPPGGGVTAQAIDAAGQLSQIEQRVLFIPG